MSCHDATDNGTFHKFIIDRPVISFFRQLEESATVEPLGKGRSGAIFVKPAADDENAIPIVRTTTGYQCAAQRMTELHEQIIIDLKKVSAIEHLTFNNAMFELYTSSYRKMRYHCDQALDLEPKSYIAIFSCYNSTPSLAETRTLLIKDKLTNNVREIKMENNSIVLFSVETNQKFLHKIILSGSDGNNEHGHDKSSGSSKKEECKWIGLTFRLSKTIVKHLVNKSGQETRCRIGDREFYLANEQQRIDFLRLRSQENEFVDFEYPPIDYTISPSDLLPLSCARSTASCNLHRSNSCKSTDT